MALVLNGSSNTITGLAVGGLPDGIVDADMLAANAVTAGKLASGVGGKILQVQSGIETSQVQYSADAVSDGPEVSITPSSTSNKILISGCITIGEGSGGDTHLFLYKGGSILTGAIGVVSSANATRSTAGLSTGRGAYDTQTSPIFYIDSPNTTSAVTYKIVAMCTNGPMALNRQQNGNENLDNDNSHISFITAMEIAA
tara:strand:+ start:952 stop:1548 length:597 start_codon:yes stop_codon:yes gene_type:complete